MSATVKVRCIYSSCGKTKTISVGDIAPGEVPMCDCGGVMVAVSATTRRPK